MAQETQTILITGAASGIGRATALHFAAKGWLVGATDINVDGLEALRKAAPEGRIVAIAGDIATREGATRIVTEFLENSGGVLTALFNCAGVLSMGPHEGLSRQQVDQIIAVNIQGVVNGIDAALPALKQTRGAQIVNMSSASAEYGVPGLAVYSASKFFLRGLTEALNIEFDKHDVWVSSIVVSFVKTPMLLEAEHTPASVGRLGVHATADQVAKAVWRACHERRVHWRVGASAKALGWVRYLLGDRTRWLVKRLTGE